MAKKTRPAGGAAVAEPEVDPLVPKVMGLLSTTEALAEAAGAKPKIAAGWLDGTRKLSQGARSKLGKFWREHLLERIAAGGCTEDPKRLKGMSQAELEALLAHHTPGTDWAAEVAACRFAVVEAIWEVVPEAGVPFPDGDVRPNDGTPWEGHRFAASFVVWSRDRIEILDRAEDLVRRWWGHAFADESGAEWDDFHLCIGIGTHDADPLDLVKAGMHEAVETEPRLTLPPLWRDRFADGSLPTPCRVPTPEEREAFAAEHPDHVAPMPESAHRDTKPANVPTDSGHGVDVETAKSVRAHLLDLLKDEREEASATMGDAKTSKGDLWDAHIAVRVWDKAIEIVRSNGYGPLFSGTVAG